MTAIDGGWLEAVKNIEELEDAELNAALIRDFQRAAQDRPERMVRFSTPTFKEYESTELQSCGSNSFPAFSITAGGCALMCDHCEARILEPMIPATRPAQTYYPHSHLFSFSPTYQIDFT